MEARRSLNDLPDIAIDEILSHLPIKDAIRTSTLSRFWRRRWKLIPDLNLSDLCADEISNVLLLHFGTIRVFKAGEGPDDWRSHDISNWLATLSLRAGSTLCTLTLKFSDNIDIGLIAHYFPILTHLKLTCFQVVKSHFCGFAALRSLCLHDFHTDGGGLSGLISACPLLETLSLRNLEGRQSLDIVAPNLQRLELSGVDLDDFVVTNAPILEMASMRCCFFVDDDGSGFPNSVDNGDGGDGGNGNERGNSNLMKVFQSMASIKNLELDQYLLTYLGRGHIPERIPINFDHLRVMSLDADLGDMKTVLVTLCLLRGAPNLQKLTIMDWIYSNRVRVIESSSDFWKAQEHTDLLDKLETVTMTQISCKQDELAFIQFLLAKARVLKTIMISFNQGVRNKMAVMKKLLGFPRVSCQARILLTR